MCMALDILDCIFYIIQLTHGKYDIWTWIYKIEEM